MPEFEDLRRIGDELSGEMRAAFLRMVDAAETYSQRYGGDLILPHLPDLIQGGSTWQLQAYAERLVSAGLIPNSVDFMNVIYAIMIRSGTATISGSLSLPLKQVVQDLVLRSAMTRSNATVTNIAHEVMLSMRDIMLDALKRGVGAEQLGRELRGSIGLLPQHRTALDNYEALLKVKKVPPHIATKLHAQYRRRLLSWRAEMIARTETMWAVHAGTMAGWLAQLRNGILDPDRTWIEWVVTDDDRLCPRCAPLDGVRIKFGEDFVMRERGFPPGFETPHVDSPYDRRMARRGPLKPRIPVSKADLVDVPLEDQIRVKHPPLHPNCRCSMRLRFIDQ